MPDSLQITGDTCPLCGSRHVDRVCEVKAHQIISCRGCGNGWTFPPPPPLDYEADDFHARNLEDLAGPHTIEALPPIWRKCLLMQRDLLGRKLHPGAKLLEIGCGEGLLLEELTRAGFETTGIEPSRSAAVRARQKGLNVVTGYYPHEAVAGGFDGIILSHVLEHIGDPRSFLRAIAAEHPEALLLLVQTNYRGAIPRCYGSRWYAWAVEQHFWHFTPEGLMTVGAPLGYRRAECEYSSLVHGSRAERLLMALADRIPKWHDQFHLLLAPAHSPA